MVGRLIAHADNGEAVQNYMRYMDIAHQYSLAQEHKTHTFTYKLLQENFQRVAIDFARHAYGKAKEGRAALCRYTK